MVLEFPASGCSRLKRKYNCSIVDLKVVPILRIIRFNLETSNHSHIYLFDKEIIFTLFERKHITITGNCTEVYIIYIIFLTNRMQKKNKGLNQYYSSAIAKIRNYVFNFKNSEIHCKFYFKFLWLHNQINHWS